MDLAASACCRDLLHVHLPTCCSETIKAVDQRACFTFVKMALAARQANSVACKGTSRRTCFGTKRPSVQRSAVCRVKANAAGEEPAEVYSLARREVLAAMAMAPMLLQQTAQAAGTCWVALSSRICMLQTLHAPHAAGNCLLGQQLVPQFVALQDRSHAAWHVSTGYPFLQ